MTLYACYNQAEYKPQVLLKLLFLDFFNGLWLVSNTSCFDGGSAQSTARIEELLQEDQNVKRKRERYQKQSSLLSKLVRQLSIHDNRAAAASSWSNDGGGAGNGGCEHSSQPFCLWCVTQAPTQLLVFHVQLCFCFGISSASHKKIIISMSFFTKFLSLLPK